MVFEILVNSRINVESNCIVQIGMCLPNPVTHLTYLIMTAALLPSMWRYVEDGPQMNDDLAQEKR